MIVLWDLTLEIACFLMVFLHSELSKGRYRYVSLIPYSDVAVNVSLKGFKYSGEHIRLERASSLGISNEITGDKAEINCRGYLFVFESED